MIEDNRILTLAEVKEELSKRKSEDKNERIESTLTYAKKFSKIKYEDVKDIKKELQGLDLMKLKERFIIKIIDILPEDSEDLKKIFVGEDVSLDQNEIEKILGITKKYK